MEIRQKKLQNIKSVFVGNFLQNVEGCSACFFFNATVLKYWKKPEAVKVRQVIAREPGLVHVILLW